MKNHLMLISAGLFAWSSATLAATDDHKGHDHGPKTASHAHTEKPIHGGVVSVVKDVNYELVAKADSISLYVTDHGKAIELVGGTAKLTILSGGERSDVTLTPAGERFEAKGNFKLGAGAKVAAQVSLPGKAAVAVRFTLK